MLMGNHRYVNQMQILATMYTHTHTQRERGSLSAGQHVISLALLTASLEYKLDKK